MAERRWRRPSTWTLRTRLLAAMTALLVAVCLVIGIVTTLALRGFLYDQLDAQLQAATSRSAGMEQRFPPPDSGAHPLGFLLAPGQSVQTLGARIEHGRVVAAGVVDDSADSIQHLSGAAQSTLLHLAADGRPHTVSLTGVGDYRVLAQQQPDGDTIVTGLPLHSVQDLLYRLTWVEALVAAAGLIAAVLIGGLIIRLSLRPLRRIASTAGRVSELPLHRGEVALPDRVPEADTDPRTEAGQVGAALNRMLGHVADALSARHDSEMRVRQFVADASHELRTPLSSIRGYAELARRAHDPIPPDVAYVLTRVESAATLMTGLVEDLLLLARLDAGRPLEHEPVDLSALVVDVVSDAQAAGPDHRWLLELPEDAVVLTGDSARLHQVLANLLANARTHTPAGTTVTTGIRAERGSVEVSVADDGPGIAAEVLPHVFERFARGDSSRTHSSGSTGLGLAIVDAVVSAHGGTVGATSRPGETRFRVCLPTTMDSQPVHSLTT